MRLNRHQGVARFSATHPWTTSTLAEERALPRSVTAGVDKPVKLVFSDLALTARIVLDDDGLLCIGMFGVRVWLNPQDDPTVSLSVGDPDVTNFNILQFLYFRSLSPQVAGQCRDPKCESSQAPSGGVSYLDVLLVRHPMGTPRPGNRMPDVVPGIDHETVLRLDVPADRSNRTLIAVLALLAIMNTVVFEDSVSSRMLLAFRRHHGFSAC